MDRDELSPGRGAEAFGRSIAEAITRGLNDPRPLTADEMSRLMEHSAGVAHQAFGALYDEDGARLSVHVAAGDDRFGQMPPTAGQGFTVELNGDRWRAVVVSATEDPDGGWSLELEIEGRYPEDERTGG